MTIIIRDKVDGTETFFEVRHILHTAEGVRVTLVDIYDTKECAESLKEYGFNVLAASDGIVAFKPQGSASYSVYP